jgi:hypothetical protein
MSRGGALVVRATRFDAEQMNRAVLVLQAPAAGIGQVGCFRAEAMDPTKCTLARIRRILEPRRVDGARALIHALRTAPADTDDAIHVLVPLEKSGPPLATADAFYANAPHVPRQMRGR